MAVVATHLARTAHPQQELALVLIAAAIGLVWDSLLVFLGWLDYPSGILVSGTTPHWIVALWMIFATTLNVSMRWLKGRMMLAALLGAVAGPLAYWAGSRLGGVWFVEPWLATIALAVGWAVAMPMLMALSDRFDGTALRVAHA
jgi:hypothetical protein